MPSFANPDGGDWIGIDATFVVFSILGVVIVALYVLMIAWGMARVIGSPLSGASPVDPPTDEDR